MKQTTGLYGAVSIVMALVMIVTLGGIGIFIADTTVTTTDLTTANVSATGTLTWSGNSSCGDLVNITNAAGTKATFYINITGGGCAVAPAQYATVTLASGSNTSVHTATNITTAINNNATINATMTASNSSTNVTTLTYASSGGALGNTVITTETAANAAWSSGTLTGGKNMSNLATMQTNLLSAGQTGSNFIVILIIAFIGGTAILYLSGMFRGRK